MDSKILIGIIIFLILILFLCKNNIEKFKAGPFSKKYLNNNCQNKLKTLSNVNSIAKSVCNNKDNMPNNSVNNKRLNCREFNSKQIFLNNETDSWCKNIKKKVTKSNYELEDGLLENIGSGSNLENQDIGFDNTTFPVANFTSLDNK